EFKLKIHSKDLQIIGLFDIEFQRSSHARSIWHRCFDVQNQIHIPNSLSSSRPKCRDSGISLHEIREIALQRLDAGRAEKRQYIILHISQIRQIRRDSMIYNRLSECDSMLFHVAWNIILADIGAWEEILLVFVLFEIVEEILC